MFGAVCARHIAACLHCFGLCVRATCGPDDQDVVVSLPALPIAYERAEDRQGLNMAVPRWLYFYAVSELIEQGRIRPQDTVNDAQCIQLRVLGWADVMISSLPPFAFQQALVAC